MTDKTKAILVIVVGSIIGGAVSSVTKIGLVKIPPFSFSFIRFFIASTLLLPFFLKAKELVRLPVFTPGQSTVWQKSTREMR